MFKKYIVPLMVPLLMTGCAQSDVNALIAAANVNSREAFAAAMVKAAETESPADDIAIAMAYAGGMGQQEFHRERDGVDYLNAFLPYFGFLTPWLQGNGGGGEKRDIEAGRDVYIDSTRSGMTAYDMFGRDDSQNFLQLGAGEEIPGYACEGCSNASMLEGKCSCP